VIAVDTNVLVRFLVQDDPAQSALATRIFRQAEEAGIRIRIDLLVLVETLWVLKRAYQTTPVRLREIVATLLETETLAVDQDALIREALEVAQAHKHDLPDCLIGLRNRGCEVVWTFDTRAAKLPGFRLLH
jgi:predicted nucleic-acid-binding protein